jgi:uncharacterized protein (TIGR00369 family)
MTATPTTSALATNPSDIALALVDIFERRIVFNQVLGLKIVSARPGDIRGCFEMREELVGSYTHGRLHGGVSASILDTMGGMAMMVGIIERHPQDRLEQLEQRFSRMGTIDLRVDFLRPGIGQRFIATAEILRLGGRVGSAQMRLTNEAGTLIATGAGSYIVS